MSAENQQREGRLKRGLIIGGLAALGVAGWVVILVIAALIVVTTIIINREPSTPTPKKAKPVEIVSVVIPPPPPPPPLPPPPEPETPPEPEEKEEMIEQEPIAETAPEEPGPEEPPADLGTGLTGDGPNSFGLSNRGDGGGRGGNGTGRGPGGRFDRYAVLLQNGLAAELRRNPKTRSAAYNVQVSIRIDADGRITSIKPKASTGNASVDSALRNEFIGIRFSEPPPADMPMPIHTRLVGRKR